MKRRLRKKYRIGEFREFGFPLAITFKANVSQEAREEILMRFGREAMLSGGSLRSTDGKALLRSSSSSAEESEELKFAREWLARIQEIETFETGSAVDFWHTPLSQ